ncbi:MAG: hypothetical protein ABTQ26_11860 [Azonexus sp.]
MANHKVSTRVCEPRSPENSKVSLRVNGWYAKKYARKAQFLKAKSAQQPAKESAGKSAALIKEAPRRTSLWGTGKVTKVPVTRVVTNESMVRKAEVRTEVRTESDGYSVDGYEQGYVWNLGIRTRDWRKIRRVSWVYATTI